VIDRKKHDMIMKKEGLNLNINDEINIHKKLVRFNDEWSNFVETPFYSENLPDYRN
jgi:hypothetical protein